jgi:hypothetical protein
MSCLIVSTGIRWIHISYVFMSIFAVTSGNICTKYRHDIGLNICSHIRGDTSLHFMAKDLYYCTPNKLQSLETRNIQQSEARSRDTSLASTLTSSFNNEGRKKAVMTQNGKIFVRLSSLTMLKQTVTFDLCFVL